MSKFHEMIDDHRHMDEKLAECSHKEAEASLSTASESSSLGRIRYGLTVTVVLLLPVLQSVDIMCMAVALPHIADHFDAFDRFNWFSNLYLLSMLAFNLAFAQVLHVLPSKYVAMLAVAFYVIGLSFSAAANHATVMLLGRAIAGVGAAGLMNAAVMIATELCELQTRITMFNLMGISYAVGGYFGSILGGVLVQKASWRWCFIMLLPLGVALAVLLFVVVPLKPPYGSKDDEWTGTRDAFRVVLFRCDWFGVVLCFAWGLSLMIAMESGGMHLAWSSPLELLLLALAFLLPPLFVLWEHWLGDRGMLRVHLFANRTLASSAVMVCATYACIFISTNYISVAYQALYDVPVWQAGQLVSLFVLGNVAGLLITTYVLSRWRRAQLLILIGAILNVVSMIGSALCFELNGKIGVLIGSSFLSGCALGFSAQTVLATAQSEFADKPALVASASSYTLFANNLGRVVGPLVGGSILSHRLRFNIHKYAPTLDESIAKQVLHRYSAVWSQVPLSLRANVLHAYYLSMTATYWAGFAFAVISLVATLFGKWQRHAA